MSLIFYDEKYESINEDPLRSFHDGHSGGIHEQIFYIRNKDPSRFYKNLTITPKSRGAYNDSGELGNTGWSIKLIYGQRRPTEEEWGLLTSGEGIILPDIGTIEGADTFTNHPVWTRIFCPGSTQAHIKENMYLEISYYEEKVRT